MLDGHPTTNREAALALRAINHSITDLDVLIELHEEPPASTEALLDELRGVASLGLEALLAAGELVSPAIVGAEARKRAHDLANVAFIED